MRELVNLGVDLGGTATEVAALRRIVGGAEHTVLARERVPTLQSEGNRAVLENTVSLVRRVLAEVKRSTSLVPMSVGMPGAVARREGLVKNSDTALGAALLEG